MEVHFDESIFWWEGEGRAAGSQLPSKVNWYNSRGPHQHSFALKIIFEYFKDNSELRIL